MMLRNLSSIFSNHLRINVSVAALHTTSTIAGAFKPVEVHQKNGVREIILNDSKTRNSLSMGMMESILEELTKDTCNEQLRAIVLSAKGPVWSAGHNLKELCGDGGPAHQLKVFQKLSEIILNIYELPVPVIAKVNGLAAAAGCQLVASCDMVVCSDKSTFSTPGANFGIFCTTPGIAVSRVMPRLKSAYMLLTALPIDAQAAYLAGLTSVVVPEAELDAETKKITDAIECKSRAVIALGKRFYYKQLSMSIKDAYAAAAEKMVENLALEDGKEGLRCFTEKRKPRWTHK